MATAFISYGSDDAFVAGILIEQLKAHDVRVFTYEKDILPGESLLKAIQKAITSHDYFIVLLSSTSIKREWVQRELAAALTKDLAHRKRRIIPILLDKVNLPIFLRDIRHIDLTHHAKYGDGVAALLATLRASSPLSIPNDGTNAPKSASATVLEPIKNLGSQILKLTKTGLVDIVLDFTGTGKIGQTFWDNIEQCIRDPRVMLNEKYMYTGIEEALAWNNLCEDASYAVYHDSISFLRKSLGSILADSCANSDNVALVILGVGSGRKENVMLQEMAKRETPLDFYPVDSSVEMMCLSLIHFVTNIGEKGSQVQFRGVLGDMADLPTFSVIDRKGERKRLFAFLGNTIGNSDERDFLGPISRFMGDEDVLLVDAQLIADSESFDDFERRMFECYDNASFRTFVSTPLKKLHLEPLDCGHVTVSILKNHPYVTSFENGGRSFTVEYHWEFKKKAHGQSKSKSSITFRPGQRIYLGHSIKYSIGALKTILNRNGFTAIKTYKHDQDGYYGAILAQKTLGQKRRR